MIKTEYREKTVTSKYPIYITSDGQEFSSQLQAHYHEAKLQLDKHQIKDIHIKTFENEDSATLYYLKSVADFQYMIDTKWFDIKIDEYVAPGWYLSIWHDGGDGADWNEVYYMPNYLEDMKSWIKDVEEQMNI